MRLKIEEAKKLSERIGPVPPFGEPVTPEEFARIVKEMEEEEKNSTLESFEELVSDLKSSGYSVSYTETPDSGYNLKISKSKKNGVVQISFKLILFISAEEGNDLYFSEPDLDIGYNSSDFYMLEGSLSDFSEELADIKEILMRYAEEG